MASQIQCQLLDQAISFASSSVDESRSARLILRTESIEAAESQFPTSAQTDYLAWHLRIIINVQTSQLSLSGRVTETYKPT
jgi:hypothetical protein